MKHICLLFFAFTLSSHLHSQVSEPYKKSDLITVKPTFGFNLGVDYSLISQFTSIDTFGIFPSSINNAPGFRFGIFGGLKIQQRFTLSGKSELALNSSTIFHDSETQKLNPANLGLMLHGKFNLKKGQPKTNPYLYFGPALIVPLDKTPGTNFKTKSAWSADFAIGLDIDLHFIYFSPELRFSGGLTNIRDDNSWEKLRGSYAAFVLSFTGK